MDETIIPGTVLSALSLEDSVRDFEIIRENLINAGYHLKISRVQNEEEFSTSIRVNKHDIILADFKLPGFDAFGALRLCNEICPHVPFICVSGTIGEETAVELLKQGAVDYILKDRILRLPLAVKRALDEAKEKEAKLMAAEALLKTEQQTRTFLDATSDMAFLKDECFRHIIANSALCKFYDKTLSEIIGKTDFDLMPEEAAAQCRKTDEQTLRSNDIHVSEEVVGDRIYETRKFPVDLVEGKRGVGAYIRDITDHKHAEEKVRLSHDRLRRFIDSNIVGAVIATSDGSIVETNDYYLNMLGFTREEFEQGLVDWRALTPPEWLPADENAISEMYEKGTCTPYEKEYQLRDGSRISVLLTDALLPGPEEQIVAFALDITDRKRADEALRERENQYRNLADAGFALIWTSGTDKLCNYFNQPWLNFTGRTLEQEIGNGWTQGVYPDDLDRCVSIYVTAFDKREAFDMEYRLRHVSGEYKWIRDLGKPNYDIKGIFIGYIGHCFDITERREAQEKISKLNESLEKKIEERTSELQKTIALLEETNRVFVGRELKMAELKERIEKLEKKA